VCRFQIILACALLATFSVASAQTPVPVPPPTVAAPEPAPGPPPDPDRVVSEIDPDTLAALIRREGVPQVDVLERSGANPLVTFRDPAGLRVNAFLLDCRTQANRSYCKAIHYGVCWTASEMRRALPTAQEINTFNRERFIGWAVTREVAGQPAICIHHAHVVEGGSMLRSVTENIMAYGAVVNLFRQTFGL
jgi:hypothetical protein